MGSSTFQIGLDIGAIIQWEAVATINSALISPCLLGIEMWLRRYYVLSTLFVFLYLSHQSLPSLVNCGHTFAMPEKYTVLKLKSRLGYTEVVYIHHVKA